MSASIWITFEPSSSLVASVISASGIPALSSVARTSSTLASCWSPAVMRLPDSKSRPRLSPRTAKESAPTSRMTPEKEKKYLLMPVKSKCQRTRSSVAPRKAGERMNPARPNRPRKAWVKTTAVNREAIVPTPSVKAKPLTPAVESTNRMKAVISTITFASMIVAMPLR